MTFRRSKARIAGPAVSRPARKPRARAAVPDLPDGRMVRLGERGHTFVRECAGPPGSVPVVLLHGWTWTADVNFADVLEPLSRWHRVLAPDVRMHGRASRTGGFTLADAGDDVVALLDELGIERAILCGYSMGGGIVADVVSRYPERVAGTVVSATAACYMQRRRDRVFFRSLRVFRHVVAAGVDPPVGSLMAVALLRNRIALDRCRWTCRQASQNSLSDLLSVGFHIPTLDLRPRLSDAQRRPSEYVVLTKDHLCHPRLQRELGELLGANITELVEDHDLPVGNPHRYAESLLAAIARLDDRLRSERSESA